jgi:predicted Ser/Thr protein kinase
MEIFKGDSGIEISIEELFDIIERDMVDDLLDLVVNLNAKQARDVKKLNDEIIKNLFGEGYGLT